MARAPRFEIVHTGAGKWHARYVAANGRVCWVTESYTRKRAAERAVWLLVPCDGDVRDVDERPTRGGGSVSAAYEDSVQRLADSLRRMTEKFDQADQKRAYWKAKAECHGQCPTDGPDDREVAP